MESGATFQMWAVANPLNQEIVLADYPTAIPGSGANTMAGPVATTCL